MPEKLKEAISKTEFLSFAYQYIDENIANVLNNDSISCFDELAFYIFLLSQGKNDDILHNVNSYDFDTLEKLFDEYIERIVAEKWYDGIHYQGFLRLCGVLNELCIFNQIDVARQKLIIEMERITREKIDVLQTKLPLGRDNVHAYNDLQFIMARMGINFTHTHCITLPEPKNMDEILQTFYACVLRLQSSFEIAVMSEFWNDVEKPGKQESWEAVYKGNLALIVSVFLEKTKKHGVSEEALLESPMFQKIFGRYLKNEFDINIEPGVIQAIKKKCMEMFVEIFQADCGYTGETMNRKKVLEYFMLSGEQMNGQQIESIYNIVRFGHFGDYTLARFGLSLATSSRYQNYNFEFFRLQILELIVHRLTANGPTLHKSHLMEMIIEYIERNKTASQLLHIYANLYKTIAFYYSFSHDQSDQDLSMKYYTIYSQLRHNSKEKALIDENYLTQIGTYTFQSMIEDIGVDSDIAPSNQALSTIWSKVLQKFSDSFDKDLSRKIGQEFSSTLKDFLQKSWIDADFNSKISMILWTYIFHGVAESSLVMTKKPSEYIQNLNLSSGVGHYYTPLSWDYIMFFTFPKHYSEVFFKILKEKKDYILEQVRNLTDVSLRIRDSFTDGLTKLPNEAKLKHTLAWLHTPPHFISIKLKTMKVMNKWYGTEYGNGFIKEIADKLASMPEIFGNLYRLSWAKFWILLLGNDVWIEKILTKIADIRVRNPGIDGQFRFDFTAGVVQWETKDIIEKSFMALDNATETGRDYVIFTHNLENSQKNIWDLQNMMILKNAIENRDIYPFFQKKCTQGGTVVWYEALFRLKGYSGKFEGPYPYLDVASRYMMERGITLQMIERVILFASQNREYSFSINLTATDLTDTWIFEYTKQQLEQYDLDRSQITFEILEWEWKEEEVVNYMNGIKLYKMLGCKIAMDDFGANNSNINRLSMFLDAKVLDEVKIDGNQIKSLASNPNGPAREFILSLLKVAHQHNILVTAEFVENKAICDILASLWVKIFQGYYFGKPENLADYGEKNAELNFL